MYDIYKKTHIKIHQRLILFVVFFFFLLSYAAELATVKELSLLLANPFWQVQLRNLSSTRPCCP